MINLSKKHVDLIYSHGSEGYPHEVCGIILGTHSDSNREVLEVRRAGNLNSDRAHDRYDLDPKDLLEAERFCRGNNMDVIGIYHSHPDHPDEPSEFDRMRAWPFYSYLIISVIGKDEFSIRSWRLNDESGVFEEEEIKITGD